MWVLHHKRNFRDIYGRVNPDLPPASLEVWAKTFPALQKATTSCLPAR